MPAASELIDGLFLEVLVGLLVVECPPAKARARAN